MRKYAPYAITIAALLSVSVAAAQQRGPAPLVGNVDELARRNDAFRRTLDTGTHVQLVVMSLRPHESIGAETHTGTDQCLFIVEGHGRAVLGGRSSNISPRSVVCVPAGIEHDIQNTGDRPMKLFTIYGPPEHPVGTIHQTRADAERPERHATR